MIDGIFDSNYFVFTAKLRILMQSKIFFFLYFTHRVLQLFEFVKDVNESLKFKFFKYVREFLNCLIKRDMKR
jgi:hypothetical protein